MVLSLLKKLLPSEKRTPSAPRDGAEQTEDNLVDFVRYVVCELVDTPSRVSVTSKTSDQVLAIEVSCEKKDIGKVIGRRGKTISAIRALTTGAARRFGKKVTVDVLD